MHNTNANTMAHLQRFNPTDQSNVSTLQFKFK